MMVDEFGTSTGGLRAFYIDGIEIFQDIIPEKEEVDRSRKSEYEVEKVTWENWYKNAHKESLVVKLNPGFKVTVTPALCGRPRREEPFDIKIESKGLCWTATVFGRDSVLYAVAMEIQNWSGVKFGNLAYEFRKAVFWKLSKPNLSNKEREFLFSKLDQLLIS